MYIKTVRSFKRDFIRGMQTSELLCSLNFPAPLSCSAMRCPVLCFAELSTALKCDVYFSSFLWNCRNNYVLSMNFACAFNERNTKNTHGNVRSSSSSSNYNNNTEKMIDFFLLQFESGCKHCVCIINVFVRIEMRKCGNSV